MRRSFRKLEAVLAVFCLAGCGKTDVETDVTVAVVQPETSRVEVTTARETEEETQPETEPEPEERVEVDGKIRSYLTGEMVDAKKANRRPPPLWHQPGRGGV